MVHELVLVRSSFFSNSQYYILGSAEVKNPGGALMDITEFYLFPVKLRHDAGRRCWLQVVD